jgi:hypothetical protein
MERMILVALLSLFVPRVVIAQQCLHGADESADQKARRREAVGATRQVNNLQANRPEARRGLYLDQAEIASWYTEQAKKTGAATPYNFEPEAEVLPGWQLTLNKTDSGYWFMIKDKTDPCGFTVISNQAGLIYFAEPMR